MSRFCSFRKRGTYICSQGLSAGNVNAKQTHQLSCSSFQAWGRFIPSMEGEGEMVYRGATGFGCSSNTGLLSNFTQDHKRRHRSHAISVITTVPIAGLLSNLTKRP